MDNQKDDNAHVDAGDLNHHIVYNIPTNQNLLKPFTTIGQELQLRKLDFSALIDSI